MTTAAYQFITREHELAAYCQQILANPAVTWIAIDTEFVRVDTYYPELSLVQLQDPLGNAVIIDPLVINAEQPNRENNAALQPLIELLIDPAITKVFHSARQDLEVLYQLNEQMPQNIFDTQIAAIFKKHGDLAGFARVIQNELNVSLEKSQTRTNWHARPLTEEQIAYALDDVKYLAPLYEKYLAELSDAQMYAVQQDCEKLLQPELYKINPEQAGSRIKNSKGLRAKGLAIVNRLAQWRESYAMQHNIPKKWSMSDEVIVQIAKRPPKTVQALYKVPNIKASSVKEFGETWIALIDEVFQLDSESFPKPTAKALKASDDEERILNLLNSYLLQICSDYRLVPSQVVNKAQLLNFIRGQSSPLESGWRYELLGKTLQMLLHGKASLKISQASIILNSH